MRATESTALVQLQKALADRPGVLAFSRALSYFGEHALGWMSLGAAGAALNRTDPARRTAWANVALSAFASHAASVIIKRFVRRPRPNDPRVRIGVGTPSKLSFPSSHATSTTAALVSLAYLAANPAPLVGVPMIMLSRMVLGVHFPTDTAAGAVLGATTAVAVHKLNPPQARQN